MSKGILPIAAASIGGLMLGLGFTVVADAGYGAFDDVASEVRATADRVDQMERVLLKAIRAGKRRGVSSTPGTSTRSAAGTSGGAGSAQSVAEHVTRAADEDMPSKDMEALASLAGWSVDESVRRRWTFASEASALDAFGPPDEIATRAASETWSYWKVDESEQVRAEYRLTFNHGRVVKGELVQWEKPRRVTLSAR